ncbi:Maf family protein [Arhodomonas sp. AD133]|uniref:Maf family protein n=1 Tax=Arhodomonas sp. AD133 TaxID=3415009 RepID=UPI003EBC6F71
MTQSNLILGSGSPYRAALLERLGIAFEQRAPDIDERPVAGEAPADYVRRLAENKARAAAVDTVDALVIGCDQIACLDGTIIGKPHDETAAVAQLQRASGRCVRFLVGLALHDTRTAHTDSRVEHIDAHFRELESTEIERYIQRERPFDCAGSFRAEGLGISLFRRLEGDDPNTLIGLPLIALCDMLRDRGWALP